LGWHVTIVWECELADEEKLATKLAAAIQGAKTIPLVK